MNDLAFRGDWEAVARWLMRRGWRRSLDFFFRPGHPESIYSLPLAVALEGKCPLRPRRRR